MGRMASREIESGETETALDAAAEARRKGLWPGAAALVEAEAHLDSGRRGEARRALLEGRAADPGNIAVAGLLKLLDLEEAGMGETQATLPHFPGGSLWCPPVLSRLVLALELELSARSKPGPAPAGLHRARSALFRPQLGKEMFRRYWLEGLSRHLERLRGQRAYERWTRRQAVRSALRAGDLAAAARLLRGEGGGPAGPETDEEWILSLEIEFVEDRFEEVARLHREWMKKGGPLDSPYPAALMAYSSIACGKADRALEALAAALKGPGAKAELHHLEALAEIERGRPARAAALLRTAAEENDIAMMQLAKEEAVYLAAPAAGN
jgi:hypothetical protein